MRQESSTVTDRFGTALDTTTPVQTAIVVGVVAAIMFTLMVVQDPLVHDAMHNFRHGTGITCH